MPKTTPIHMPNFNPPIPNMKDKNIQRRVKVLGHLETAQNLIHANPVMASRYIERAMAVLRK